MARSRGYSVLRLRSGLVNFDPRLGTIFPVSRSVVETRYDRPLLRRWRACEQVWLSSLPGGSRLATELERLPHDGTTQGPIHECQGRQLDSDQYNEGGRRKRCYPARDLRRASAQQTCYPRTICYQDRYIDSGPAVANRTVTAGVAVGTDRTIIISGGKEGDYESGILSPPK